MSSKQNLLIIGATGYIGTHITSQILANKTSFGRTAIFTSPHTVEKKPDIIDGLKKQGAEIIVGDTTNEDDLVKAFQGIINSFSPLQMNKHNHKRRRRAIVASQTTWIKLASQSPTVTRFFPSEYGTDIEYGPESATEKPHQAKLQVRAALRELEAEAKGKGEGKGLEYTFLVTGPYAEAVLRAASFDVKGKKAVLMGDGKGRISLTTKDDVGRLTVKALLHPSASKNRALRVNSFTASELDILAEFERQTGGEKWSVQHMPFEELRRLESEAWEKGDPMATGYTLRRIWAEGGTLYEERDNGLVDGEDTEGLGDAVGVAVASQVGQGSHL
ncbi:Isoflavone reductase PCBER-like protein [Lachnellula arida]|uniref:Isoflavone reductase PCBER-like protein n=1 Tax=Lachnellula arida TaxID=1316785 RepID=A0A8T9B4X0_9HELO|nr:Isoflavone reductase PCBER-like protein [Lachnellula arida]